MDEKEPQRITAGLPILTAIVSLISVLSFLFPEIASVLIFDRDAVLRGEVWRVLSCHCVHFTATHLAYNLAAFGVAGWIVERKGYPLFGLLYVLTASVISTSLLILKPAMTYYGGLSGIACGIIFYGALVRAKEPGPWRRMCQFIVICLPVKIAIELCSSASILPYWGQQRFVLMPMSHAAGIGVAFLFFVVVTTAGRYPNRQDSAHSLIPSTAPAVSNSAHPQGAQSRCFPAGSRFQE